MAKTIIEKIKDKAEKLREIRDLIAFKEEQNRKELEDLKIRRDEMQSALLAEMNKNQLASIKTQDGQTFSRALRKMIEITSEVFALKWALQHKAIAVNKIMVNQILRDSEVLPQGFERNVIEYISVRKPKDEKN